MGLDGQNVSVVPLIPVDLEVMSNPAGAYTQEAVEGLSVLTSSIHGLPIVDLDALPQLSQCLMEVP